MASVQFTEPGAVTPAYAPDRAVRAWIWTLVAFVLAMVTVGGATRLTGSGLSITEWAPVTGAIPPLSEAAWLAEFERYRQIDQYRLLNQGMSLAEFQVIYWWEWGHRQLGRALGLVFFLPLVYFWLKSRITTGFALTLIGIGALGGMQAFVGWIMVASGLEEGMIAVAPIKLMTHLMLASIILVALTWIATGLRSGRVELTPRAVAFGAYGLVGLILFQTALGALVAGSRAGWTYNTWPLMDGVFIPSMAVGFFPALALVRQPVRHCPATIQFNHRMVAYLLVGYALWHAWRVGAAGTGERAYAACPDHGRAGAGAGGARNRHAAARGAALGGGWRIRCLRCCFWPWPSCMRASPRDAAPARRRVDTGSAAARGRGSDLAVTVDQRLGLVEIRGAVGVEERIYWRDRPGRMGDTVARRPAVRSCAYPPRRAHAADRRAEPLATSR